MQEFDGLKNPIEKTEVQEKKKNQKHVGRINMRPGMKVFKWFDGDVKELKDDDYEYLPVEIRQTTSLIPRKEGRMLRYDPKTKLVPKRKVKVTQHELNNGVLFIEALNRKNAVKKFQKKGKYIKPKNLV